MPDMPTAAQLQTVKNTGIYSVIDGDAFENYDALREGKLSIRVIVPITNDPSQGLPQSTLGLTGAANASNAAALNRQQLYLQLIQPVAADTAKTPPCLWPVTVTIKHLFFRANHSKAFTQVLYCLSFCSEPLGH